MLNYLWAAMILIGITYAMLTGNIAAVTDAALDSAGEAISLCITMAGVMAFWMGLMEIATKAGIILPDSAKEKPEVSVIVAVGPGGIVDGKEVVMTLKVGEQVITGKYTGTQVKLDGVEYTIVSQSDILAVVE